MKPLRSYSQVCDRFKDHYRYGARLQRAGGRMSRALAGRAVPHEKAPEGRSGDPAEFVGDPSMRTATTLAGKRSADWDDMVQHAWNWFENLELIRGSGAIHFGIDYTGMVVLTQ